MNLPFRPNSVEIPDDKISTYCTKLDQVCDKNPAFIKIIVATPKNDLYSAIKRKLCVERGVQSQVMTSRVISKDQRNLMSVATKVAVQVNAKLGGLPWMIDIPIKGLMVIGFDVYHDSRDKSRSFGALVATMDLKSSSNFFSAVSPHRNGQELCNELALNTKKALMAWVKEHGTLPERIMFYRDGVGEGQTNYVYEHEVEEVKKVLETAYAGRENSYKLAFIVVSKRINTKFFATVGGKKDNTPAGTVVDDVVTLPERYDFFIVAQSVNQGTATPTNYNVLFDNFGFPPERVQQLTFKYCHLYVS